MAPNPHAGLSAANSRHSLTSRHNPVDGSRTSPRLQMHPPVLVALSTVHSSPAGQGLVWLQPGGVVATSLHPCLYGSPSYPLGHSQANLPGSLRQTAPAAHGSAVHSSMSTHPPRAPPVNPGEHIHLATVPISMHSWLDVQRTSSHGSGGQRINQNRKRIKSEK